MSARVGSVFLALLSLVSAAEAQRLPAHVRQNAVDKLFAERSEITLKVEEDWPRLGRSPGTVDRVALWFRAFLVPRGYFREREGGDQRFGFRWEYDQTEKLPGSRAIKIGRRLLRSIDFVNSWKEGPGIEKWVVKFSYSIEPLHAGIPGVGPFKGEGRASRAPWQDKWEYRAEWGNEGGEYGDFDLGAYRRWIEAEWRAVTGSVDLTGEWQGTKGLGDRKLVFTMTLRHRGESVAGTVVTEPDPAIPPGSDYTDRECREKRCSYEISGTYRAKYLFVDIKFSRTWENKDPGLRVYSGFYPLNPVVAVIGISNPAKMLGPDWIAVKVR